MKVATPFPLQFIDGFTKKCQDLGMSAEDTEAQFRIHANNQLLSRPHVMEGFSAKMAGYRGTITKAAMAKYMTPTLLAAAVECQVRYGSDPLSSYIRKAAGMPDPDRHTKRAAQGMAGVINNFDYIPLPQKIMLGLLGGGGLGAVNRLFRPTDADQTYGRGMFSRATRGMLRGAGIGAGAAAGAAAGSDLASRFDYGARLPGMILGGTMGGLGAHRLANDIVD